MFSIKNDAIFLSLPDIFAALKKGRKILFCACLLFSFLTFFYLATRPVRFKAEGIFKGESPQAETPLLKALETLGGEDSYLSSDNPRSFLKSYPVLEGVVLALDLQATVVEAKKWPLFPELWHNLKIAQAYRSLKNQKSLSRIQTVLIPERVIIPDKQSHFRCTQLHFFSETASTYTIDCIDERTFAVKKRKKEIGKGTIGLPFIWEEGSFILLGEAKKGVSFQIQLIPLKQAVESLKRKINIVKDRENSSITYLTFTHSDRHLAAAIVNETMEQYQNYLKREGKKKISKQLSYLHQRKEETLEGLEGVLQKHKTYLEANLDAHRMLSLEKELQYLAQKQAEKRQIILETDSEMESLSLLLGGKKELSLERRLEKICTFSEQQPLQALTIDSARHLIQERQHELDLFFLDKARYDYCLGKLKQAHFDSSSLAKILNDHSLKTRFEKIHAIHRQLIDAENWSEKEKEHLKTELETERLFLIQHIYHLKEGAELQAEVLQARIRELQKNLLILLAIYREKIIHSLELLNEQAADFPQKWLLEQKIDLNTKLSIDMMESITKMIEVKNIGYNLNYLMTSTLQAALPPVIPENPLLISGSLLGLLGAFLLILIAICFYQVWVGPSASEGNLTTLGYSLFSGSAAPQRIALSLQKGITLVSCKRRPLLLPLLTSWLAKKGETFLVVDLNAPNLFEGSPLFVDENEKEAFLTSTLFKKHLLQWKREYQHVFLLHIGCFDFIVEALQLQVDHLLYGITDERCHELEKMIENSLFFFEKGETQFTLATLEPLLASLLQQMKSASYFSSAKAALDRFLLKRF